MRSAAARAIVRFGSAAARASGRCARSTRVASATAPAVVLAGAVVLGLLGAVAPGRAAAMTLAEDPFVQQGERLTSPEVDEIAEQGYSVALSANGDTAIVGSPAYKENASEVFAGAAWIYTRAGTTWTLRQKLVGSEGSGDAHQGYSVALSANGETAIVGAPEDEGEHENYYGAAWVFRLSGGKWEQIGKKLVASGPSASSKAAQGSSVALSADGDTALVGADTNGTEVGAAFVFVYEGGQFKQQGEALVGKPESRGGLQGWSVALSGDGDTALIAGPKTEGEHGENEAGAVWVATRSGSTWSKPARLPAGSRVGADAGFGESVALAGDGSTALVGGIGYDHDIGGAWAYTRTGEKWEQQGSPLQGNDAGTAEADSEGHGVALSEDGDTALIGGPDDDVDRGAAWAFQRTGSGTSASWSEQQKLEGTGGAGFEEQGFGVALSGDAGTALVGGIGQESQEGAAWVFARQPEGEAKSEPEKEPVTNKEPAGTGSGNNGGGSGSQSGTSGSSLATTPPTPGVATTPQAIEELRLGCSKRALVLNDVLIRDGRVLLQGSAAKSLEGKSVKIVFDGHQQVAKATVAADGEFATTAPLPPARLRDSNNARYLAEQGSQRSLDLKLTRRLELEPPTFSAGAVTLTGQVLAPLATPVAGVTVQQQLECGRTTVVKHFKPGADGRFRVTVTVPADAKAGIYRLTSAVAVKPGSRHAFATYSLPLPVLLG
jgi:hypothetical protein